jgi:enoyl-[acyl-carrier-protein] reductase (NADH)
LIQGDIARDGIDVVKQAAEGLGGLDMVVVTTAPEMNSSIDLVTPDEARGAFDTLVHGFRELAVAARPHLAERGGSIVAVSSLGSERTSLLYGAMGPANAALEATVRYLAVALGPDHIRVNAVAPLLFEEASQHQVGEEVSPLMAAVAKKTPFGHEIPTSSGIARTIAALLSDDMRYVTGQVFKVDGGYSIELQRPDPFRLMRHLWIQPTRPTGASLTLHAKDPTSTMQKPKIPVLQPQSRVRVVS